MTASKSSYPAHMKRYFWFRLYDDFDRHPKWRQIAKATGQHVTVVMSMAASLLCAASRARSNGNIEHVDMEELAEVLDVPVEHVALIYAEFERRGWLQDGFIVDWVQRQPQYEDPNAAERQRRRRAKLKEQRAELCAPGMSRRDIRDVTLEESLDRPSS